MGHYFLDTQYVQKGAGPTTTEKKRVFLGTQRDLKDPGRITNKSKYEIVKMSTTEETFSSKRFKQLA